MRRLLPKGTAGAIRAQVEGDRVGGTAPGIRGGAYQLDRDFREPDENPDESKAQRKAADALGTQITAFAQSSTTWFAGSGDGRLWSSRDSGNSWDALPLRGPGRIEAIETAGDSPHSALIAVAATANGPRVIRAINDGFSGDDLSSGLPEGAIHGLALDAAAGVAYAAGDHGVFTAQVDMNSLKPVTSWQAVPGLPEARVMDVRLDAIRNMLYVALDGYGLYAAPSPHKNSAVRVLTAADQPAQSAAPGVLLHVEGSGLSQVKSESGDLALISSSAASTQVQVPFEASGSMLALTVESSLGQSRVDLPLRTVAPSILVDGDGLPILVDAASGLTLDARNMARPGDRIQVFASGLGRVNPEWRAGVPAPEDPPSGSGSRGSPPEWQPG